MANYVVTDTELTNIANSIREKSGTTASLSWPTEYISAIENMQTGGGDTYAVIYVDYPEGCICTATNGVDTLTALDTSGFALFGIPTPTNIPEVWTINCTNGEDFDSTDIAIRYYGQIEHRVFNFMHIWGVSWDGTSNTQWTRTDLATYFTDPIPYKANITNYGSPFDTISPWKDMVRVTNSTKGQMVKIPKFWYKLTSNGDNAGFKIQISDAPQDGFVVCPACKDRGDGLGVRDYILLGRYISSSNKKSETNAYPKKSTQSSGGWYYDLMRSSGVYQTMNFDALFTIWLLYLVEYADWNSKGRIGLITSSTSSTYTGRTDNMPYHTGITSATVNSSNSQDGIQYRYIEGLWSYQDQLLTGISTNGTNLTINNTSFTNNSYNQYSKTYPSAFQIVTIGSCQYFIPSTYIAGSTSTYTTDRWAFNSGSTNYTTIGMSYEGGNNTGLFYIHAYSTSHPTGGCVREMIIPSSY